MTTSGMATLHERIAKALGWSVEQTQTMSLATLRELVRPVDSKLAHLIACEIAEGGHIFVPEPKKKKRRL